MINEWRLERASTLIKQAQDMTPKQRFSRTHAKLNEALKQIEKCLEDNKLKGEPPK